MDEHCPQNMKENFDRPGGIIKLKVKKRRSSLPLNANRVLKPKNSTPDTTKALKRSNPFSCTPRKKPNISRESRKADSWLFKALDKVNDGNVGDNTDDQLQDKLAINDIKLNGFNDNKNLKPASSKALDTDTGNGRYQPTKEKGELLFPVDWSLKTKLRFTSSRSFSWCNTLKTKEESKGLAMFVRCGSADTAKLPVATEESRAVFQKGTMVWIHPSLPWLNLFPRNSHNNHKLGKKPNAPSIQDPEILECIHQHWTTSFRSVFNLLRVGYCPHFYLCANHCSMVFKAAGITERSDIEVLISPTTKGLREALGKEGVTFTMPHLNDVSEGQNSRPSSEVGDKSEGRDVESEDSDLDSDVEADWLDSMGLEKLKKQFPGLRPDSVTRAQMSALRTLDQHPSSTVLIQGTADTQALFNFLLNCKSLIAPGGSLAGIPPTLLAPVAFDGAALQSLRVNQGVIKRQISNGFEEVHSLEVLGPILPNCMYGLCELLKDMQSASYTVTTTPYQPSVAFNKKSASSETSQMNSVTPEQLRSNCGLSSSQFDYYQQVPLLSKSFLKDLSCKDGLYSWSTNN